jgi:hypothetical protein
MCQRLQEIFCAIINYKKKEEDCTLFQDNLYENFVQILLSLSLSQIEQNPN